MKDALISIIIPIYNGEKHIEKIMNALFQQTFQQIEIILVDDGSKDDSYNLCKMFEREDSRVHTYSKQNGGASSARNYGLEKANGNYIAFLDVDDYIYPDYFEKLYCSLVKCDADMSCCNYYKMWETEKLPDFPKDGVDYVFNREDALLDLLYRKHITGSPCLKLYKKSTLNNKKFPIDLIYGEDFIFTFQVLASCRKVVYNSQVMYIYYQHASSATHQMQYSQYEKSWNKHILEILEYVEKNDVELIEAAHAKCFILSIDYLCRIWKCKECSGFKLKLLEFIEDKDSLVFRDKNCKNINRVLAAISCISPILMIGLCRMYNNVKNTLKIETRKSV